MTINQRDVKDALEMLQRKMARGDEAPVRRAALLGDKTAQKTVRQWDREDGAKAFPHFLPDGREVEHVAEVAALLNVKNDVAARYVLHTPGLNKALYKEAIKELHMMTNTDFSGSSIIMLRPNWNDAKRIAMVGGEDYAALHVTMGYYGSEVDKSVLNGIAARVCARFGPFEARLNGITRFSGKEEDALVVNVDSPIIEEMRRMIVDLSKQKGLELDKTHGYTPHMTLGYLDKHERSPIDRWSDQECLFPEVNVGVGNGGYDIHALHGKLAGKMAQKDVHTGSGGGTPGYHTQEGLPRRGRSRREIVQRPKRVLRRIRTLQEEEDELRRQKD